MTDALFPVAPKLTDRQAHVYAHATGPISAITAGRLAHELKGCLYCQPDEPCQYAEQAGREVLEALRKKGLLRRDRHHRYTRTDAPPVPRAGGPGELPADF